MKNQIVEYNEALGLQSDDDLFQAIEEMKTQFMGLTITDTKTEKKVRAARTLVVSKRTATEARRLELNKAYRAQVAKDIEKTNKNAAIIQALIKPIEDPLQAECKRVDQERADAKAEKERKEKERVDSIRQKITGIQLMASNLSGATTEYLYKRSREVEEVDITEKVFQEFTGEAQAVLDATYVTVQDFIIDRQKFEKEEKARQAEAARLEAQRKEQEAAQKELDEAAARHQAKIDADNAAIQKEKDKIEAEKKAAAQKEREKEIAKQAAEKAKKEEQERLEREAKARADKEKADKEEAERKEALKPDKEKLLDFAKGLMVIAKDDNLPDIRDEEARELYLAAIQGIKNISINLSCAAEAL